MDKDTNMESLILESYKDLSDGEAYTIVKHRYGERLPFMSDRIKYKILAIEILESDKQTMEVIKSRVTRPIKYSIRLAKRENDPKLVEVLESLLDDTERSLNNVLSDMDLSTYNPGKSLKVI